MKYIVERLLTNAQRMDTDMVSDVEAKIESLKGKTIEVPLDFLYKLQEFLIASSCMHDEGMMKANYHTALLILHQSLVMKFLIWLKMNIVLLIFILHQCIVYMKL